MAEKTCNKCGGLLYDDGSFSTAPKIFCTCPVTIQRVKEIKYGWVCPLCNRGISPFIPTCDCHKVTVNSIIKNSK